MNASRPNPAWIDGTCNDCGWPTIGTSNNNAPPEALSADGDEKAYNDYYVFCGNDICTHALGTRIGDQECPPNWATHEKPFILSKKRADGLLDTLRLEEIELGTPDDPEELEFIDYLKRRIKAL